MPTILEKLTQLAQLTRQDVTQLLARVLELGREQLWTQTLLDLYLRGRLSREEAIQLVGVKWVERAEQVREAVLDDVRWGLSGWKLPRGITRDTTKGGDGEWSQR